MTPEEIHNLVWFHMEKSEKNFLLDECVHYSQEALKLVNDELKKILPDAERKRILNFAVEETNKAIEEKRPVSLTVER